VNRGERTSNAAALDRHGIGSAREEVMAKKSTTRDSAGGGRERWLLRFEEAGDLLGVSRSSIYNWIHTKNLPTVRIGNCRRIPMDELRQWVEDQNQET
jgi:excisionase family DNA binding protein